MRARREKSALATRLLLGLSGVIFIATCTTSQEKRAQIPVPELPLPTVTVTAAASVVLTPTHTPTLTPFPVLRVIGGNIMPGAAPLPISSELSLVLSADLKPSPAADAIKVFCNGDKLPLPGRTNLVGRTLSFHFERRFFVRGTETQDGTAWIGLKPDSSCEAKVFDDRFPIESRSFRFSTEKNDYGIYFLGADGEYEKAVPGTTSRLYNPNKPLILFLHGWENTTTANGFFRENPFIVQNRYYGSQNLIPLWKKQEYNIALFYWPQFADEPEVLDAEAKVWQGNSGRIAKDGKPVEMRFRLRNGSYGSFGTDKSVTELLLAEYVRTMELYSGPGVRLVAHSLGSQLASNFMHLLSAQVEKGKVSKKILPSRVVLLDPFFGKGSRPYLGKRWPGELCREYLKDLIKKHEIALEFVKTSLVGSHLAGDRNLDLRAAALYYRLKPNFIPLIDQKSLHWYAYVWYLGSLGSSLVVNKNNSIGAAASDADIRQLMNAKRAKPVTLWQEGGNRTPAVADDVFALRDGVSL